LALFESEFSATDHTALYRWRNWVGLYACSNNNAENGKTRQVTLNSVKADLPAHEVCTTPSVNKKENISFTVIAAAALHPPAVKSGGSTLFQGPLS